MKRSEMIKKMMEVELYSDPKFTLNDYEADKILMALEEQGMLPPETDKMIEGHLCSVNEWEPETTTCKDCGVTTEPGIGSARCKDCWNSRFGEE